MADLVAELLVDGSKGNTYTIMVEQTESGLTFNCNCKAGIFNKGVCRHRLAVIQGDESILTDDGQVADLQSVTDLIAKSSYPQALENLPELERKIAALKKEEKIIKTKIHALMKDGG